MISFFFFFNDPATTEISTLPLHDALPIFGERHRLPLPPVVRPGGAAERRVHELRRGGDLHVAQADRKSTRLNSSHGYISYAVFCLKKKKKCFKHLFLSYRSREHVRPLSHS